MIFIVFPFTGESHPMTKGATVAKKAKSSEGANKAQFIRDALDKLGIDAPAKEIQALAAEQKMEIAPAQISNIRTKLKEGGGKRKKGRAAKASTGGNDSRIASDLIQARVMADKMGGVERAKTLLDLLNKLR